MMFLNVVVLPYAEEEYRQVKNPETYVRILTKSQK